MFDLLVKVGFCPAIVHHLLEFNLECVRGRIYDFKTIWRTGSLAKFRKRELFINTRGLDVRQGFPLSPSVS